MQTRELHFDLPPDLIATQPAEPRDAARLLVVRRSADGDPSKATLHDHHVRDLPALGILQPGDLMLVNESRVLPALFHGVRRDTGGKVQGLFISEDTPGQWLIMLESRGKPQPGEWIDLTGKLGLELRKSLGRGQWLAAPSAEGSAAALLEGVGQTPLPPYIRKARKQLGMPEVSAPDAERYNTIYAGQPGSVAAPTAGLHFTPELIAALEAQGVERAAVTLHVGIGTFAPVRTETLTDHPMHAEQIEISPATLRAICDTRARGGRILCVGTTTVRAVESLPPSFNPARLPADGQAVAPDAAPADAPGTDSAKCRAMLPGGYAAATRLFIHPEAGFTFRFADRLMTNFHLPESTLLAMVASLPGVDLPHLKQWYGHAIDHGYRFFSYGDAMVIM